MIIHIKHMVCIRCIMLVKNILDEMGLQFDKVELGIAELKNNLTGLQKEHLKKLLAIWRLELIEDNNKILVEKIKKGIIQMVCDDNTGSPVKASSYLSSYLKYNYTYLANVFASETGTCLRNFIIAHRIEKVKEMLIYEKLSVTEIAWKLNYSSVAHLSNQFTKITGFTPSQFKKKSCNFFISQDTIGLMKAV